jgi:hypothetical protein
MLDNRNRVIAFRELFRGTIDGASVYPREVVKQALADNAAAVILAHNPLYICNLLNYIYIYLYFKIYTRKMICCLFLVN